MKAKKVYNMLNTKDIMPSNIIDIREKYEIKGNNIRGSKNIPMNTLINNPDKYLKKDQTYYLICQSGARSFSTWISLKFKGYKVRNISGGMNEWKNL